MVQDDGGVVHDTTSVFTRIPLSTQLRSISSRWQTGRTGVFRNPFNPGAFEAGRLIEMKTRGNPSGPEATKASPTGRIYGSSCAHRPLPSKRRDACKSEESIYGSRNETQHATRHLLGFAALIPACHSFVKPPKGTVGWYHAFEHGERWEHHAASTHAQNDSPRVTRTERGSTGCKWMSSTPAAGSPVRRDV